MVVYIEDIPTYPAGYLRLEKEQNFPERKRHLDAVVDSDPESAGPIVPNRQGYIQAIDLEADHLEFDDADPYSVAGTQQEEIVPMGLGHSPVSSKLEH